MDSKHDMIESCVIFLLGYLSTYCEACSQVPLSSMHFYMKGHVIEERRVSGLSKCVYNCMVTTDCLSFNFEINTNWCQLNSADVVIGTEELTTTSDQMFFSNIRDWPTTMSKQCSEHDCRAGQRCFPGDPPQCFPTVFKNPCKDGYQYALGYRLCYKLVTEKRTQHAAHEFCTNQGAELLQIRSKEENVIVTDYLKDLAPDISPIIDGKRVDGSFVYLDGSQMSYFHWKNGNPSDRDCIKLQRVNYNFKFASTDCDAKKFFMCQIRLQ